VHEELTTVASPEGLGRFCDLRQQAWQDREQKIVSRRPSADPVIGRNHFTNIYRELDPGTKLARALLDRYDLHTLGDQHPRSLTELYRGALWTAVAYRLTNRRSTWEAYLLAWNEHPTAEHEKRWLEFLEDERASGEKIFTGRHLTVGWPRYVRALQEVRGLEDAHVRSIFENAGNFLMDIKTVHGVGDFFAWQVTADLLMSGHLPAAPDVVHLGPGAKLALRWIVDRRPFAAMFNAAGRRVVAAGGGHMTNQQAHAAILDLRTTQHAWLPPTFSTWAGKDLDLVDLEHALCEYGRWGVLHHRLTQKESR
jgi:hypothetical protein